MWKIGNGVLPAPERKRGEHDVNRQGRIWLQSPVEASGHIGLSPHVRRDSRGAHPLADHRAEVCVAVELAPRDLAGGDEAEEQDERTVLGGQRALRLHAPAELLVQPLDAVGGPERLPLGFGKLKKVSSSAPPSCRLLTTPGLRLPHVRSKAVQAVRALSALGA